ncbi:filamin C [Trichuris trichiura]|uniref:Filamin C n=1 Tax=Trichuris trichiura TaxID=36087 RepID=A0A077ZAD0_TRITR|nr:filamin C [Trichuris trichiura]
MNSSAFTNDSGIDDSQLYLQPQEYVGWKRIQQNTFTRWVNEHLRNVQMRVDNLETDLTDGLILIKLVEILSKKKLPRHNAKPTFRSQKLENVSVALTFLSNVEGIKLVNIDSSDIVDQRLKLILGLIWTLILHYSISVPIWEDDRDFTDGTRKRQFQEPPKQRLLNWLNTKLPQIPVTNFTSQWSDGRTLGALVDSIAPGLCPEWKSWKPAYALKNTTTAMDLAEQWLTVPKLIEPEEFISPDVDELSMMTYLSQYPHAKLRPGAPLKPPVEELSPSQVLAYGPGLSQEIPIEEQVGFNVDVQGRPGDVEVFITDPLRRTEKPTRLTFDEKSGTYMVQYTPKVIGSHQVTVRYNGRNIAKSPFNVRVVTPKADIKQMSVSGPGLRSGLVVGKPTYFDIFTAGGEEKDFQVSILDSNCQNSSLKPIQRNTGSGILRCEYTPIVSGLHSISVFYDHELVSSNKSPFEVWVAPAFDANRIHVVGRGIQASGVRLGDRNVSFRVTCDDENAEAARLLVKARQPDGLSLTLKRSDSGGVGLNAAFCYEPRIVGIHKFHIFYNDQELAQSPFEVAIGPTMRSAIKAFGPGLKRGVVDKPCKFTVETNGEVCSLGFSVEGPDKAEINCNDNTDGSVDISYVPKAVGEYAVHILANDEDIPDSPFMVDIVNSKGGCFPALVECHGTGLARTGNICGTKSTFVVDASHAGRGDLHVCGYDSDGMEVSIAQETVSPGVVQCQYVPQNAKAHSFFVTMDNQSISGSPFRVYIQEPCKPHLVRAMGPGLEAGVKTKEKKHFFVDCKEAGPGELEVTMLDQHGEPITDIEVADYRDGTYTVYYKVDFPGTNRLFVRFNGKDIPGSPFNIVVEPYLDLSDVQISGLESSKWRTHFFTSPLLSVDVFVDAVNEFVVDARTVTKRVTGAGIECLMKSPDRRVAKCHIADQRDGTYRVAFSPTVEGKHELLLSYDGLPVTKGPLLVEAKIGSDPKRCKVTGLGLTEGIVGVPCRFSVDTRGAGNGNLGISVEGPSKAVISCTDNNDGTCTAEYQVSKPGEYKISVLFADQHISGSPFTARLETPIDASLVTARGPGLDPAHCRYGIPLRFLVDASKSGPALLNVLIDTESGAASKQPEIIEKGHGLYEVVYQAPLAGTNCSVHVLYGGKEIPNSPFTMRVMPAFEPKKVIVTGCSKQAPTIVHAGEPVSLNIDTSQAGYAPLQVLIKDPEGLSLLAKHTEKSNGQDELSFVPEIAGIYEAQVKLGEGLVSEEPFRWKVLPVGNARRCLITEGRFENAIVGEEQCVKVRTEPHGEGKVTCQILPVDMPTKQVETTVEQRDDVCLIFYTFPHPGYYRVSIRYGGELLEKGQWLVKAEPGKRRSSDDQPVSATPLVGNNNGTADLRFSEKTWTFTPPGTNALTAKVIMPTGRVDAPLIKDNADGSVTIKYQPSEPGLHELHIKHKGLHISGSPFNFFVGKLAGGCVTAYGNGLSFGIAGEPAAFTVCVKQPQGGGLSVKIEGPAKADVKCYDNKDGTCTITWIPPAPGEYLIHIQYAGNAIDGSPFRATVSGEGRKRAQISVGSTSEVSLRIPDEDTSQLSASIKSPSGIEEPCATKKLENGNLGVSFTPREPGEHLITVKKHGVILKGSPFSIKVNKADVGDASKVVVTGAGIKQALTQEVNTFVVDTRSAGYGGLSVSLEGPSRCEIQCRDNKDKTSTVSYKPYEPGVYALSVKFADHHVPGSPFTIHCEGKGVGSITEKTEKVLKQASVVQPGDDCIMSLKIPGTAAIDLNARIMTPDGNIEDVELWEESSELYMLRFVPRQEGVHTLSVLMRGSHIAGSPFQYTVGSFGEGGSHKVHAGGAGLISGEVNLPLFFNIYSREAGPGLLQVYVEGPSKALVEYKETKSGDGYVMYKVSKPGDYNIAIKFNDVHIPDSPFKVFVSSSTGEARKLEVCSFPESYGLPVNKPVTFTVVTHGAQGHLDAKVISPSGATDDCFITPIEEGESYAIRFIPKEVGNHYVHITLDGIHMKDSPFRFRAGPKGEVDPIGITVCGEGLRGGETGQKCEFIVNTCHVGPGNLQVQLDGPSKATLNAYDVDVGYKVRYTPLAPGDYFMTIKYNGIHIPGSPFKIAVTGRHLGGSGINEYSRVSIDTVAKSAMGFMNEAPKYSGDAAKVTCQGGGLKKAFANRHNTFSVDCSKAGLDLLTVGVMTHKGPGDEVLVKHNGRGNFIVNYMVRERGTCFIHILYGNKHVPGSPFMIQI